MKSLKIFLDGLLDRYVYALKFVEKKEYLTPFFIIICISMITVEWSWWAYLKKIENYGVEYQVALFVKTMIQQLPFIFMIICYPFAIVLIRSNRIYKSIFNKTSSILFTGMIKFNRIGWDIPDDKYIHAPSGNTYTLSANKKSKRAIVSEKRDTFIFFFMLKFIIIDICLRYSVYFITFVLGPLIFLIAVPKKYR